MGESNRIAILPRIAKKGSNKGTYFRPTKDYVLCYAKHKESLAPFSVAQKNDTVSYPFIEDKGQRKGEKYRKGHSLYQASLDARSHQRYYIEAPDGTLIIPPGNVFPESAKDAAFVIPESNADGCYRWSFESYLLHKEENMIMFDKSKQSPLIDQYGNHTDWNVYEKKYEIDECDKSTLPDDVIYDYLNSAATAELNKLDIPFDFSKPTELMKYLMEIAHVDKDSVVLDFYSGSASTAHSVMKLNAEDGGNRKFIMVQANEPTAENSEARKAGYENICEIGKERIRRAGKMIKEENSITIQNLDTGFRVLKQSSSNLNNVELKPQELTQKDLFADKIKTDRTSLDLLFDCMLRWGITLDMPLSTEVVDGCTLHLVNDGVFIGVFDGKVTSNVIDSIAQRKPVQVVFRDDCFASSNEKLNVYEKFKQVCGWSDEEAQNNIRVI